jgi:hypothetical protein
VFKALMMVRPCTKHSYFVINMTLRFSDNPEVIDISSSGVFTSARKFFKIVVPSMRVVKMSVRVIPIEPPSGRDAKDYVSNGAATMFRHTDSELSQVSSVY